MREHQRLMNMVITVPQNACPEPDLIRRYQPIKFPDLDERRMMRADERDLAKAAREAWELLNDSNIDSWLFRYAGKLTYLTEDDEGFPIPTATEDRLLLLLAHLGDWVVEKKFGFASEYPPRRVASALLSTPNPDVPVLRAIVNTPVFGKTGQLMTTYGYHPDARLSMRQAADSSCRLSRNARLRKTSPRHGAFSATSSSGIFLSSDPRRAPTRSGCSSSISCAT